MAFSGTMWVMGSGSLLTFWALIVVGLVCAVTLIVVSFPCVWHAPRSGEKTANLGRSLKGWLRELRSALNGIERSRDNCPGPSTPMALERIRSAASALAKFGPEAAPAVPLLILEIESPNWRGYPDAQQGLAVTLVSVVGLAGIPELIRRLKDGHCDVVHAVETTYGASAGPVLLNVAWQASALNREDVRRCAMRAIGSVGDERVLRWMLKVSLARGAEPSIREDVVTQLARIVRRLPELAGSIIPVFLELVGNKVLLAQLSDPCVKTLSHAVRGAGDEDFIAALVRIAATHLRDTEISVRSHAITIVVEIGEPAVFLEPLIDQSPSVRASAIVGLRLIAKTTPELLVPLIPDLSKHLGDTDETAGGVAAVFAAIGKPALDELITACRDPREAVRRTAIAGIGRIGKPAREALFAIVENLTDKSIAVQSASIAALSAVGAMDEPVVIDAAIAKLNNENYFPVGEQLAQALTGVQRATSAREKYRQRQEDYQRWQAERDSEKSSGSRDATVWDDYESPGSLSLKGSPPTNYDSYTHG